MIETDANVNINKEMKRFLKAVINLFIRYPSRS